MKLTPEERMDIGRRMYTKEISYKEAMEQYGISETAAHKYMTEYKKANGIPLLKHTSPKDRAKQVCDSSDMERYMSMSKEELINELILAKVNELRAKKGYEVKGDGANKEFISLNNKNSK